MRVKNINNTSDKKCKCGSWMNHWMNECNKRTAVCSAYGCSQKDNLHGSHVQKATSDFTWYIIPLCPKHNKSIDQLEVKKETNFALASISETCGR